MTGNQDSGAAGAEDWGVGVMQRLQARTNDLLDRMDATPIGDGDVATARRGRLIGVLVRTAKAILALDKAIPRARDHQPEDEMKHRDDSPENLERMRARIEADLDRVSAALEEKGVVVPPGEWPCARSGGDVLRAA